MSVENGNVLTGIDYSNSIYNQTDGYMKCPGYFLDMSVWPALWNSNLDALGR